MTGLEPGQRVIAEGIVPDRVCAECVRGHTHLCLIYSPAELVVCGQRPAQSVLAAQLGSGPIRLSPVITHRFPLEAYEQAYQVLRESTGPRGKVMLDVIPKTSEGAP